MKLALGILVLVALGNVNSELPQAEPCNENICKLPECRCSSVDIPGGLAPRDTPQVC